MINAAFYSLRDVVLTWVRGKAIEDDGGVTASLLPRCPPPTERFNLWGPRLEVQLVWLDYSSGLHRWPTRVPSISAGAFVAVGNSVSVTGNLEAACLNADDSPSLLCDSFRSLVLKPGIEYSPVLTRYLRYVAAAEARGSLGDLFASSGRGAVGSVFDGFDVRMGLEAVVLYGALRGGLLFGSRRSALQDEYSLGVGWFLGCGARL